jgi:hypothetical protein
MKKIVAGIAVTVLAIVGVVAFNITSANAAPNYTSVHARECQHAEVKLVHGHKNSKCVAVFQDIYNDLGYSRITVDGDFGDQTWRANFTYETAHGWKHDGIVSVGTFKKLASEWDHKYGNRYGTK